MIFLFFSGTFEEHIKRIEAVFSWLHELGLKLKPSKCEFFKSSESYLRHVVSANGVETEPEKIKALCPNGQYLTMLRLYVLSWGLLAIIVGMLRTMLE